jgi:hypothetical protein
LRRRPFFFVCALCPTPPCQVALRRRRTSASTPPTVELVYDETNNSPLLKFLLSKVDELKFRVTKKDGR